MALLGFPLAAGVPAAGEPGSCVPDHSWLSKTRTRLPREVHVAVFDWVLARIADAGLVKGDRIGGDASAMEANAALRNIVRRDPGEGYREMLEHLARESGIETPTAVDPAECVADKGYHSRAVLKALDDSPWKTRISEPKQNGF